MPLTRILREVRTCRICEAELPLGPRPVVQVASTARLLIIGQAPGSKVHQSGIPWNDASGDRLRDWLKLDHSVFYDEARVAILPMGFCYSGAGEKGGDMPPRPPPVSWQRR
jgi:uracil-DNA glycosylase